MLFCGCGILPTSPDVENITTQNEAYLIEKTHEIAKEMGTWVDAKLTDTVCSRTGEIKCNSDSPAAGWVPDGGKSHTIYYWRPYVNAPERTLRQLDGLAKHEVGHVACGCDLGEGS